MLITKRLLLLISLGGFLALPVFGQKISRSEYIDRYAPIAVGNMKHYGIPASITLAQGLLESDNGNSTLARRANNHFGIKCHADWKGPTIYHDDDRKGECFRKYRSPEQSFADHSRFLTTKKRYAFLFKLDPHDYRAWAYGLKKAGYATDPRYPEMLIRIIEENKLFRFDAGVEVAENATSEPIDSDRYAIDIYNTRPVKVRNRIKYIVVREGDTFKSLTRELKLMPWQLYRYNDLVKGAVLKPGQELYIQPKRRKAERGCNFHVVKEGETMYSISQAYGIKLRVLYRKNRMALGTQPEVGQTIYLRKRKKLEHLE